MASRLAQRSRARPARVRALLLSLAGTLALAVTLSACAAEPVAGWLPPTAPESAVTAGVLLVPGGADPLIRDDTAAATESLALVGDARSFDAAELGLAPHRLRNDALGLAARFVYVPGVPAFNDHVDRLIWAAIGASGQPYVPEVHPVEAGLADRGCVAGSAAWPAAEVLSRPETGPVGGTGTAITCEVTGAFGSTLVLVMRTVTGSVAGITSDELQTLYLDVSTGGMTEGVQEWREEAPAKLWAAAGELLRLQAGALSTAPLAAPDATQLALAAEALASAAHPDGGGLRVTLPPGLTSSELEGIGVGPTTGQTVLQVDAATANGWASDQRRALLAAAGQPFVRLAAAGARMPIDCALLPCVALTYDDGPSGFTPELLDTLAAHHAAATFYMIGGAARGNPEVVARVADEGHEVGSHTMNHKTLTKIPLADARAQVHDAAALLRQLSGQPVATYRPPYGAINADAQAAIDMPSVLWSIDTNDWQRPGQSALYERAVLPAQPGHIILFHDTHADTVNAAGDIIIGLQNRGFELVTVTELFGGAVPDAIVRRG
ncbi:polysaccharide deacetylase family protein [Leucobacter sp. Z1108]|uniref:polysaccharide deacetylase family protein n=1 Tax=Leucobacter sp. Z1108 TaxID=3439066 RepID=UPI003F3BBE13